jgi:hypothetical protein
MSVSTNLPTKPILYQFSDNLIQKLSDLIDLIVRIIPSCELSQVDQLYSHYSLIDMLSFKKNVKLRTKGIEILLGVFNGILLLRNQKNFVQDEEKCIYQKFPLFTEEEVKY